MSPLRWTAAALSLPLVLAVASPAVAKGPAIINYKNCATVHLHYKGGVAKPHATDKRRSGGHAKYKPYVNAALYAANAHSDRDKDGIACEQ
jgi:hypothetical protein